MKRKLKLATFVMCVMLPAISILTACDSHSHIMNSDWSQDASYHWHACLKDDCGARSDKSEHTWRVDSR